MENVTLQPEIKRQPGEAKEFYSPEMQKIIERHSIKSKYKMKTFISFDYENDHLLKQTFNMWAANPNIDFKFDDGSSKEINSWNIVAVKRALSRKINEADNFLVIVGRYANAPHKDRAEIGYKNWQNYEIAKAKEHKKKIIAVKLDRKYTSPDELYNAGATWAMSFTLESIKTAIQKAQYGR